MAAMVIDASIVMAVALPDEASSRADSAMQSVSVHGAWCPIHWPLEVANGLLVAERRQRVAASLRQYTLRDLAVLPIELDGETNNFAWNVTAELAARHGLTAYDAAYLELALRKKLPLATLDAKLARAARAEGVAIFGD
jgi:predicted nucleic acid-binding protein